MHVAGWRRIYLKQDDVRRAENGNDCHGIREEYFAAVMLPELETGADKK